MRLDERWLLGWAAALALVGLQASFELKEDGTSPADLLLSANDLPGGDAFRSIQADVEPNVGGPEEVGPGCPAFTIEGISGVVLGPALSDGSSFVISGAGGASPEDVDAFFDAFEAPSAPDCLRPSLVPPGAEGLVQFTLETEDLGNGRQAILRLVPPAGGVATTQIFIGSSDAVAEVVLRADEVAMAEIEDAVLAELRQRIAG